MSAVLIAAFFAALAAAEGDESIKGSPLTDEKSGVFDEEVCYDPHSGSERVKSDIKIVSRCGIFIFDECVAGLKFKSTFDLLVDADADGAVERVSVETSSNGCLNGAVESSVSKWTFDTNGAAVKAFSVRIKLYNNSDQYEKNRLFESFRNY